MTGVHVRGNATAEELAAVLAVVAGVERAVLASSGYDLWRRTRLAAVRRAAAQSGNGADHGAQHGTGRHRRRD